MASSPAPHARLSASHRALAMVLALAFAALPLAVLLQGITVRILRDPPAPAPQVAFVPLPPPDADAPPAEPLRPAGSGPAAAPVAVIPVVAAPTSRPASPISMGSATGALAGDGAGPAEGARPPVAPPAVLPPLPAPMPASANGEGRLFPASWAEVPSQRLLGKHNPPRARYEGVSGGALLACRVLPSRRLADCAVLRETPEGYGFGKAALEAAADFRVNPPMLDGQAVAGGRVAVPVAFRNREPRP